MLPLNNSESFPAESETVEYKEIFNEKCKREIAAFLNGTQTAYIYFGISDGKKLVKLVSDSEKHSIEEQLSHWLSSGIYYPSPVGLVKVRSDNDIFCIEINPGPSKPYFLDSRAYIRNGSESVKASAETLTKMVFKQRLDTFDISESPIQDLKFDDIKSIFKKQAVGFKPKALGFFTPDNKYTDAALLFSDENTFSVKVAVFDGLNVERFKDRREFLGSIPKQIDDVLTFVNLNNALAAEITGKAQRLEKRSYPSVAIREAVVNAIVHRSYFSKSPIQIEIFDDRLTIMSPGPLPGGMKLEAILDGQTLPRNPQIVKVLYKLKYIEDYGTGIRRIIGNYENEDSHPDFNAREDFVKVTLPNLNYQRKEITSNFVKDTEDIPVMSDSWKKIIEYLKTHDSVTRPVVESILGVKRVQSNKYLNSMVNAKIIQLVGIGKSSRYILIYHTHGK